MKTVCPISNGRPTKMTRTGFDAACARFQQERRNKWGGEGISQVPKRLAALLGQTCKACGGKVPAEIEIISIEGKTIMASKTVSCEMCGDTKNCRTYQNKMICNACIACMGQVKAHPDVVLEMLLDVQGEDYLAKSQKIPAVELLGNPEQLAEIERLREQVAELQQDLQHVQIDNQELTARIAQMREEESEGPASENALEVKLEGVRKDAAGAALALLIESILTGKVSLIRHKNARS